MKYLRTSLSADGMDGVCMEWTVCVMRIHVRIPSLVTVQFVSSLHAVMQLNSHPDLYDVPVEMGVCVDGNECMLCH